MKSSSRSLPVLNAKTNPSRNLSVAATADDDQVCTGVCVEGDCERSYGVWMPFPTVIAPKNMMMGAAPTLTRWPHGSAASCL